MEIPTEIPNLGAPFVLPLVIEMGGDHLVALDECGQRVAWAGGLEITMLDVKTGVERRVPCRHAKGKGRWFDYGLREPTGQLVFRGDCIWLHDRRVGKLWRWDLHEDEPMVVLEYPPGPAVLSEDGGTLLHMDGDAARRVDVVTGVSAEVAFGTQQPIVALGLSLRGDHAVALTSRSVHWLNPEGEARTFEGVPMERALNSVAISASGAHVVASGSVTERRSSAPAESYLWSTGGDAAPRVVQARCVAFVGEHECTFFCGWRGAYSLLRLEDSEQLPLHEFASVRAVSGDGSTLATVSDYRLDLVDVERGEQQRVPAHKFTVSSAVGTPRDLFLAYDGMHFTSTVQALDSQGRRPRSYEIPRGGRLTLSVSADGAHLAVSGATGVILLETDNLTPRWQALINRTIGPTCFLPSEQLAAAGDRAVHFVDGRVGKAVGSVSLDHDVFALAVLSHQGDSPALIAAGEQGATRIDLETRKANPLALGGMTVDALSPCGRHLLLCSAGERVVVSVQRGERSGSLQHVRDRVADWRFQRGTFVGDYFLGIHAERREICAWTLDGALVARIPWPFKISHMRCNRYGLMVGGPSGHHVAWSPRRDAPSMLRDAAGPETAGRTSSEVSKTSDGASVRDPAALRVSPAAERPRIDGSTPRCLDGAGEVVVFGKNHLMAVEVSTGRLLAETRLESGLAESLCFDGGCVIVQSSLGRDSNEAAPVYAWDLHNEPVLIGDVGGRALALSRDGRTAIVDGLRPRDSHGYLKDRKSPALCVAVDVAKGIRTELGAKHRNDVKEVVMSANGLLATVDGAKLRVFGLTSSRPKTFAGPKGTVPEHVALSRDGRYVAGTFAWKQKPRNGGCDLFVWEVASRTQVLACSEVAHRTLPISFVGGTHSLIYWSPSPVEPQPWDSKKATLKHIGTQGSTPLPALARVRHAAFSDDGHRCAFVAREITVVDLESGDILLGSL